MQPSEGGIAVCLAASMSYQNLVYNINLLSGGWHFKATKKNCLEPSDICRQLSIRLLPTNRPKWPTNRPSSHLFRERNGSTLWGFFRNFYRSFVASRGQRVKLWCVLLPQFCLFIEDATTNCVVFIFMHAQQNVYMRFTFLYFLVKDKLQLIGTLWGSKEKLVYF